MKKIEIADQTRLSFGRTARITIDGIRYRLFRSMVTVAVIAVAVAFLMNVLSESLIKRSVVRDTRDRMERLHVAGRWSARLTAPGSPESIIEEIARSEEGDAEYREAAGMGKLAPDKMNEFHRLAREAETYFVFFANLDYARQRALVHTARGGAIFDRLATPRGREKFTKVLKDMKSVRFVTSLEKLQDFLAAWPTLKDHVEGVRRGRAAAIDKVKVARGERSILEALLDATGEFGRSVRKAGFQLDDERTAPLLVARSRDILDTRLLEKSIRHRPCLQVIAQHNNIMTGEVTILMMWDMILGRRAAARYLEKMKESSMDTEGLSPERLVTLARNRREETALGRAERLTVGAGKGWMGLGERLGWLLIVSMLVCAIGITNAMLMSVTERFREIATMKCLGALDGFIMLMFVLESCVLGVVGGCIGALLGSLIGTGRMLAMFGTAFARSIPIGDLFLGMAAAVVLGVVLAAVAAVYPSFKAARLAPMEAMRIE